jgi:hypothetical protein
MSKRGLSMRKRGLFNEQKRPINEQKRPINEQKRPIDTLAHLRSMLVPTARETTALKRFVFMEVR